jgi:hypothetical protein
MLLSIGQHAASVGDAIHRSAVADRGEQIGLRGAKEANCMNAI